jgi:hypothetical protein
MPIPTRACTSALGGYVTGHGKGPDFAARGPPARGDLEVRSNQKFSHASEAEAVWAARDGRGKAPPLNHKVLANRVTRL